MHVLCLYQVDVTFDLDHAAVGVVFKAARPLVVTDDVKFKFFCANVYNYDITSISSAQCTAGPLSPHRRVCRLGLTNASSTFGVIPPSFRTTGTHTPPPSPADSIGVCC